MKWYSVEEDLPPPYERVLGYSDVHEGYYMVAFSPKRGWVDCRGERLSTITHWSGQAIALPWDQDGELDKEAAEKYGVKEQEQ